MKTRTLGFLIATAALPGCNCPPRPTAQVPGEERSQDFVFPGLSSTQRDGLAQRAATENRPVTVVALSGGAQNGAFGAGILCNWADAPRHVDMWTGVSTGALLLTHAFLIAEDVQFPAPDLKQAKARYRVELEEAYTKYSEADIMSKRGVLKLLSSSAMASMDGLRELVGRYVTDDAINRVAAAAAETDVLTVGTTDMDTGNFVAWDLKKMARARMYGLYRKVVFASCLEPVAMDPEYIAGHMHADGGVRYQIFAPLFQEVIERVMRTEAVRSRTLAPPAPAAPLLEVYLLVNGRLEQDSVQTGTCLLDIAMRAVDVLALESKLGNLFRIQAATDDLANQVTQDPRSPRFRVLLTAIDPGFTAHPKSHFDPDYMQALFDHGKTRVTAHTAWYPYRIAGKSVVLMK